MNRTLADLDRVVALGGGHGLGRVMSALAPLGSRLTGHHHHHRQRRIHRPHTPFRRRHCLGRHAQLH